MKLDGYGGREDLGGDEGGGKNMIKIHCMKKINVSSQLDAILLDHDDDWLIFLWNHSQIKPSCFKLP